MEYHPDMNQPCRVYKPTRSHWRWIAAIWLAIALFSSVQNLLMMRAEGMVCTPWTRLFVTLLLSWLVWVVATPFVLLRLGRQSVENETRHHLAHSRLLRARFSGSRRAFGKPGWNLCSILC